MKIDGMEPRSEFLKQLNNETIKGYQTLKGTDHDPY